MPKKSKSSESCLHQDSYAKERPCPKCEEVKNVWTVNREKRKCIVGPKGDKGRIGPQGPKGAKGSKGDTGPPIASDMLYRCTSYQPIITDPQCVAFEIDKLNCPTDMTVASPGIFCLPGSNNADEKCVYKIKSSAKVEGIDDEIAILVETSSIGATGPFNPIADTEYQIPDGSVSAISTCYTQVVETNEQEYIKIKLKAPTDVFDLDWLQLGSDIVGEALFDFSGGSVSLSDDGKTIAIGAEGNDGNGLESGHVRVYKFNGATWNKLGADIDGEMAVNGSGVSVSISGDGLIVAIGAPLNSGNGPGSGHVRVYKFNGVSWNQLGADIEGEASFDRSGVSVSISRDGTIVAIGAPANSGTGHVRVYKFNGLSWNQLGDDIDGEAFADNFGFSVSISSDGSTVAIGGPFNDGNGNLSGHTRVYKFNGVTWNQLGSDIDGETMFNLAGISVSISDDGLIVAIGASFNSDGGSLAGHVRVYKFNGIVWNQLGTDIDGETAGEEVGTAVAISGNGLIVAIGAPRDGAGRVKIYKFDGVSWNKLGTDIDTGALGDESGRSVSISNDGLIVAFGSPSNNNFTGYSSVYKFDSAVIKSARLCINKLKYPIVPNLARKI